MKMDPERRRRLVALGKWNDEWSQRNEASAPFDPTGQKPGGDYNLHYVDLEASGQAQDVFHDRAMRIVRGEI